MFLVPILNCILIVVLQVPVVIHMLESRSQLSVQLQVTPGEHSTVHSAFQQLLQFGPLLDDVDIKLRLVLYFYKTLHNHNNCEGSQSVDNCLSCCC